jgi:hypothetical protein
MFKKITRQGLADAAAERWAKRYDNWDFSKERHKTVGAALKELGPSPDPDLVDKAIGSTSWTHMHCDGCKDRWCGTVVSMPSHSDGEYGPCHYCRECLTEATRCLT